MSSVVLVGPSLRLVTGQSVAFSTVVRGIPEACVVYYEAGTDKGVVRTVWGVLRFIHRYRGALRRSHRPTVYFTSSRSRFGFLRDAIIVLFARRYHAERIVNHLHGADFLSFRESCGAIFGRLVDTVYRRVTDSVVLADAMRRQYERYAQTMRIHTAPNAYDPALDELVKRRDENSLHILYLSNIMKTKGIFELMDAVRTLYQDGYAVEFHIAGRFLADTEYSAKQVETMFYRSLDDACMVYHGVADGLVKKELLKTADIVCLPSYYSTEAQPISLIEGMAAGCFLIATKQGYIESIMSTENGLFVDPESSSIGRAVRSVLRDPSVLSEVYEKNRTEARRRFSQDVHVRAIRDIVLGDAVGAR